MDCCETWTKLIFKTKKKHLKKSLTFFFIMYFTDKWTRLLIQHHTFTLTAAVAGETQGSVEPFFQFFYIIYI